MSQNWQNCHALCVVIARWKSTNQLKDRGLSVCPCVPRATVVIKAGMGTECVGSCASMTNYARSMKHYERC